MLFLVKNSTVFHLVLADNHYGSFDRMDRFLLDPDTGDRIPALDMPEDVTLAPREIIYRKYNRPDGCIKDTVSL